MWTYDNEPYFLTKNNNHMKFLLRTLLVLMMPLWLGAQQTVVDIIAESPDHNTLEAAIIQAELDGALSGEGPFTVFAPTDAAFSALPAGLISELLSDPSGDLTQILLYHVLGANVLSSDLMDGMIATTLQGQDVSVTINADGVFINDAQVTVADIEADNGVVHVIDAVLVPASELPATVVDIIVESDIHNTLEAAVIAAGLAPALSGEGPFTVFAPTDEAFANLPAGLVDQLLMDPTGDLATILTYHVIGADVRSTDLMDGMMATTLQGQDVTVTINADGIFINDAQVIVADIEAENGVVHVIDAVLVPATEPELPATVVDIIVESDIHNTLEAAVIAAGLAPVLSGEGPFTVFAPTDEAFANLPAGLVDQLLMDPTGDLATILTYHVIGADVRSTDLMDGMMATTLQGQDVTVTINADGIFINDAQVILADIEAENGVVHVIDAVLLPNLTPATGTAMVQIIHNAFDETVGVYANGEEIIPSIAYLTATPYFEVPAGINLDIELRSRRAFQPADPVFVTVNFEADETYIVGVQGTFDESDDVPVEFVVFDRATPNANASEVGVQLLHGVSDAPAIDVVSSGASIFDDVSYGEFGADFLFIPAANGYRLDVTTADNSATVGSYKLDIEWWKSNTLTIFATGSLDDGTFYPYVALSNGGTYPIALWDGPGILGDDDIVALRSGAAITTAPIAYSVGEVTIAPNPFRNNTVVTINSDFEAPMVLELFDMNGNIIKEINLGVQAPGVYTENIDLDNQVSGMYILKIQSGKAVTTKRIIKVK